MNALTWHKVAAVSGVAALALGTYGAHGFRPQNPSYKEVWHTASLYHLVHTAALVTAPFTKHPHLFGGLLTSGILFVLRVDSRSRIAFLAVRTSWRFVSSFHSTEPLNSKGLEPERCYTAALYEDRKYSMLAPVGGFAFIAAWASLLF